MATWIFSFVILAESARWQSMGSGLRGRRAQVDGEDVLLGVGVLVAVIVAVAMISRFRSRHDGRTAFNSPRALFRSLSKAHGLGWKNQRLLGHIAKWQRVAQPSRLFLEPDRFEAVNLSRSLRKRQKEIQALRERLFGAALQKTED